jgi:hypothetical protein
MYVAGQSTSGWSREEQVATFVGPDQELGGRDQGVPPCPSSDLPCFLPERRRAPGTLALRMACDGEDANGVEHSQPPAVLILMPTHT